MDKYHGYGGCPVEALRIDRAKQSENMTKWMKAWNFTQVFPSGMQSCSSTICFFERHKILIVALMRRGKGRIGETAL